MAQACTCLPATIVEGLVEGARRDLLRHAEHCALTEAVQPSANNVDDVNAIVGVITRVPSKATCRICGEDYEFIAGTDADKAHWSQCPDCTAVLANNRNRYMVAINAGDGDVSMRTARGDASGLISMPPTDAYNLAAWLVKTASGAMGDNGNSPGESSGYARFRALLDAIEVPHAPSARPAAGIWTVGGRIAGGGVLP